MKQIKINGVDQAIETNAELFADLVESVSDYLSKNKQVISKIIIDGKEISEADETKLKTLPVSQIASIDFIASNPFELAQETINTLEVYLEKIIHCVNNSADSYKKKSYITADAYFVRAIDSLDLFVQTIGGIKLALKFGLNQKVALTEVTLVSVMNDLLDAKRQNNYIFLAELLEKDLVENLVEWKTVVFPIFKAVKFA